jgi:hypothetical protein
MRHRAGSWKPGRTAGGPAGVNTPRPGHRVHAWIVAAIVAVHAAVVALAWQPAASPQPQWPRRMSMRLVANKATTPVAAAVVTPRVARPAAARPARPLNKPAHASQRPTPATTSPTEQQVAFVEPVVVVTTPIQGVAFAPAVIGFGPPPARHEPTHPAWMPPTAQPSPVQAQLLAARAQVAEALQREVAAWQAPQASQGACALSAEPDMRLACDNELLSDAITPREAALAGLLRAWRGMDPHARGLTIAVVDGRYRASWN